MSSFAIEVIADDSGAWTGNSIRLPTKEEAEAYGGYLYCSWVLVREWRVVTSEDPANYHYDRETGLVKIAETTQTV